ncbi:MAG: 50S ribosomal protein L24 [Chlamydiota bacterium]
MKNKITNKRLREGDKVIVIAGNDKGKTGTILSRKNDDKIVVQGVNIKKKHQKRTQEGPGQILEIEAPINASNVMLCPADDKGVRLRARDDDSGQRQYVYKDDNGQEVVYRAANKKAK